jgi:hypothetical protein
MPAHVPLPPPKAEIPFSMKATLTAPAEELFREQVASGQFASVDSALEASVQTVFVRRASQALETLLDEALSHQGRRVPVAELRNRPA